jgi:hypothetical protein
VQSSTAVDPKAAMAVPHAVHQVYKSASQIYIVTLAVSCAAAAVRDALQGPLEGALQNLQSGLCRLCSCSACVHSLLRCEAVELALFKNVSDSFLPTNTLRAQARVEPRRVAELL